MKYTNRLNLPEPYVNAVVNDDYNPDGDISVTGLTNPPRQFWLKKRHNDEIEIDVSKRIFAIYGKAVHSVMEKHAGKNVMSEERLKTEVNGWVVTGQPDLFTYDLIQDWKLTSAWVIVYDSNKREYELQLNLYRYLAAKVGFDQIKSIQNVFLIRDWSRSKAKSDPGYPQEAIEIIDQELHPLDEIENYLVERVRLFQDCEKLDDDALPPCTPEERWHKEDKWAVKKSANKKATKVCDTKEEAESLLAQKYRGVDAIEFRPGDDVRCKDYCDACRFCNYWKEKYGKPTVS